MGMAASQARFLGLTARKNNVEFEGQQINQQRTALSNQSASYYTNLLSLKVPQPPSVQDFTKTTYSFTDGALTNQLTTMVARTDGSYIVSYLRTYTDDHAIVSTTPSRITRKSNGLLPPSYTYSVGVDQLRELGNLDGMEITDGAGSIWTFKITDYENGNIEYTTNGGTAIPLYGLDLSQLVRKNANGEYEIYDSANQQVLLNLTGAKIKPTVNGAFDNDYYKHLTTEQFAALMIEEQEYASKIHAKFSQVNNEPWFVRYIYNASTGAYMQAFYDEAEVTRAAYDQTSTSVSYIGAYTVGSAQVSEEIKGQTAFLEQDSTGRYINITLIDPTGKDITYALSTSTVTDDAAYTDAMNQYEFDKARYDKSVQEINTKIEIIQVEDKDLELRLKQLDTERTAIDNEMDAVKQVIKKNVESTFKTFG